LFVILQIERVYSIIKSLSRDVKFSLSPFGLYRPGNPAGMPPPITGFDPYSQIYADALLWLQQGWVDFMAPQLYWAINSTGQSYPMLLDWWLDHNTASKLVPISLSQFISLLQALTILLRFNLKF
jgi:uncharacterized lipoprotein YddW (UPF0748 family)